jgi:hypothetical protein
MAPGIPQAQPPQELPDGRTVFRYRSARYRKLKLGEPIGLLAPTEREAISNGDDQPAY